MSPVRAIFRGRCYFVVSEERGGVWLEQQNHSSAQPRRLHIPHIDPELLLDPSPGDLQQAAAFERGEIKVFEYPNGHTYPSKGESLTRDGIAGIERGSTDGLDDEWERDERDRLDGNANQK